MNLPEKQFLDFAGLSVYDSLIKAEIKKQIISTTGSLNPVVLNTTLVFPKATDADTPK